MPAGIGGCELVAHCCGGVGVLWGSVVVVSRCKGECGWIGVSGEEDAMIGQREVYLYSSAGEMDE